MNYEEPGFKIDNENITFKRSFTTIVFVTGGIIPVFFMMGRMVSKDSTALIWFLVTSAACILLLYRTFYTFSKTRIFLADITQIEVVDLKTGIPFKGTGKPKNYFPAGLNKKTAEKVLLVHQKGKRLIIGLAPQNYAKTISFLKERGIPVKD